MHNRIRLSDFFFSRCQTRLNVKLKVKVQYKLGYKDIIREIIVYQVLANCGFIYKHMCLCIRGIAHVLSAYQSVKGAHAAAYHRARFVTGRFNIGNVPALSACLPKWKSQVFRVWPKVCHGRRWCDKKYLIASSPCTGLTLSHFIFNRWYLKMS